MLEISNPFLSEYGVIRLFEPDGCDRKQVVKQILSGAYDKPYLIEEGDARSLYFSRELTQSGMRISDPTALEFAYTQKMMSVLFFVPQPKHILMLGLGGGSLAKYCYRHLPTSRITAIEIDANILAFRDQFMIPPDDARWRVVLGDAALYLRDCVETPDVVMIDAFDRDGFSDAVCTRTFYLDVRDALAPTGAMVANMVGPKADHAVHLSLIADVFGDNIIACPVEHDGNYLVFAFRDACFEPRWRWIEGQAKAMKKRYGLDFPKFSSQLKRCRKDGYLLASMYHPEYP